MPEDFVQPSRSLRPKLPRHLHRSVLKSNTRTPSSKGSVLPMLNILSDSLSERRPSRAVAWGTTKRRRERAERRRDREAKSDRNGDGNRGGGGGRDGTPRQKRAHVRTRVHFSRAGAGARAAINIAVPSSSSPLALPIPVVPCRHGVSLRILQSRVLQTLHCTSQFLFLEVTLTVFFNGDSYDKARPEYPGAVLD